MIKTGKIQILYKNNLVRAQKLNVSSEIPVDLEKAWAKVKTSALLEFVAKGMIRFVPIKGHFPEIWQEGSTVETRSLLFGFIPFGGVHTLFFEKIDDENKSLQTKEFDDAAKVWNHTITMKKLDSNTILYEDEIIIYGGFLTFFITLWASYFYQHRQKRWLLVGKS
jgi:hypothetical protein